jgi:hypothetical protein
MRDVATMNEKAQAWLGNLLGWGQRRQAGDAEKLYAEAVRLARNPVFFDKYGVADDVDGRFDALSLIVTLVMRRLKSLDDDGKVLAFPNAFAPWPKPLWGVLNPMLMPLIIVMKNLFRRL